VHRLPLRGADYPHARKLNLSGHARTSAIREAHPMPEKTVKRRLQDCDAALASDDGPIFSTVANLVEALKRSIPEGTRNAKLKNEALRLARELLRGTKYEET
jgi:hypothetical protein